MSTGTVQSPNPPNFQHVDISKDGSGEKLGEALGKSLSKAPKPSAKVKPGHANLGPISPEGEAWYKQHEKLAAWVITCLVNRTDVFGGYKADGGQRTAKEGLTPKILAKHFRPITAADIIGLHTTAAEQVDGPDGPVISSTCRWVTNDIDHHADGVPVPDINERATKAWYARAVGLGFHPLLLESNGNGGYRVFILFREPIQSDLAYHFIRWLQRDWADLGFTSEPECFPKQERIGLLDKAGERWKNCGNWVHSVDITSGTTTRGSGTVPGGLQGKRLLNFCSITRAIIQH